MAQHREKTTQKTKRQTFVVEETSKEKSQNYTKPQFFKEKILKKMFIHIVCTIVMKFKCCQKSCAIELK